MRRRESPKTLPPRNFLFSRRDLLKSLPLLAAACSFRPSLFASSVNPASRLPAFELIPPSASGIKCGVHTAGEILREIFPEIQRSGLRLFRLRQRRLDGRFPGQQRPLRFLPASRRRCVNALYRSDRDGGFTDVTEKAGVAAIVLRHGHWRPETTTTTGSPITVLTPCGPQHPLSQQQRRDLHRCDGDVPVVAAPGWSTSANFGSTMTTTAGSISSSAGLPQYNKSNARLAGRRQ